MAEARPSDVSDFSAHLRESCTMGDLVLRAIGRGADSPAFIEDGRTTTYAEFGRRLSQFTQALGAAGMGRGSSISALAGNTVDACLVTAACQLLGVRLTNLHPMGSLDDHAFIVTHCDAEALVFDAAHHCARAAELAQRIPSLRLLALGSSPVGEDLSASAQRFEAGAMVSHARADDICWIVYTGGTTGKPKGVVHTHSTLVAVMLAELAEWEWPLQPVFLAITPISHGAGPCILPVLLRGGTVVLETGFSPEKFLQVVVRYRVTASFLVPTMIYKILDHVAGASIEPLPLEMVVYGAAPMAPARMKEALGVFGSVFMQLYGQSEVPNCISVLRKADHDPARFPHRLASCGQAIASNQVALLDEHGAPVADGATGEICVRGPLVMAGYWKDAEESARALRHGWLHTGDLARRDKDGYLYIVGRSKDMIISGGFNVYPAEVEDVVSSHPAVSAVAVVGVPDVTWGEAVKALVVLRQGHAASEDELIACVRAAKGPVHAPKSVEFLDALPLTSLGKPDKKLLRQRYSNVDTTEPVDVSSSSH